MTKAAAASPAPDDGLNARVDRIDTLLPQTQCQRCGYPACRPYAEAIACGEADINQCPPGGAAGIRRLAALLGRETKPLSPAHGSEQPLRVAVIDEALCIGCTLCIKACPVDAIVGANKLMHTVLAAQCTGCELCIAPCPVDCIDMVAAPAQVPRSAGAEMSAEEKATAEAARRRYEFRRLRLQREERERAERLAAMSASTAGNAGQASVAAALARAQRKRSAP